MIYFQRISRLWITALMSAFSLACGQVERSTVVSTTAEGREIGSPAQDVANQTRIRDLITTLSTEEKAEQAKNELVAIAKRSTINRDRVIQGLITGVKAHEELNRQEFILGESFSYWFGATRIFRLLEATEAIDVMIECIHCGNGLTGSLSVQPAFDALQAMGRLAIPQLSKALSEHPQKIVRAHVALCLGNIGGTEARNALRHALETETDKNVIHYINWGLSTSLRSNPSDG